MNEETAIAAADRFAFGENWKSFLVELDEVRIAEAERSLRWLTGLQRLDGLRFVDIGSGSGLSSLAARRLGAKVASFDYDNESVACTNALRDQFFSSDPDWHVEQGSILDRAFLDALGRFDIVYSWGVLHHTGAMHDAIANASQLVAPGGTFVLALYRKTRLCSFWVLEKRWYSQASARAQSVAWNTYTALIRLAFVLLGRDFRTYVAQYRTNRGMDFEHDVHDWLGGYPYESVRLADIKEQLAHLGFTLIRSRVKPYQTGFFGSGCDEFVYRALGEKT